MTEEEKVNEVIDVTKETNSENNSQPPRKRWNIYDTLGVVGFGVGIESISLASVAFAPFYGLIFGPITIALSIVGLIFEIKAKENSPERLRPLKIAGYYVNLVTIISASVFLLISIILTVLSSIGIIETIGTSA